MKKYLALVLAALMALTCVALVACGGDCDHNFYWGVCTECEETDPNYVAPVAIDEVIANEALKVGEGKVYLTSIGQANWSTLTQLADLAGLTGYTAEKGLTADQVEAGSVVVVVVGGSSKGLGASTGFTKEGEVARAEAFAAKTGIEIVLVQIGGEDYRGELSDPMIKAIAPAAKVTMLLDTGNYDGLFTATCPANTVYAYTDEGNMVESLAYLFA